MRYTDQEYEEDTDEEAEEDSAVTHVPFLPGAGMSRHPLHIRHKLHANLYHTQGSAKKSFTPRKRRSKFIQGCLNPFVSVHSFIRVVGVGSNNFCQAQGQ